MITVSVNFKDSEKFSNFIRYIENISFVKAEAEVMALAEETLENMKLIIDTNRVRDDKGTHELENALGEPEEVVNNPGRELVIGVGNIDTLNKESPYWEMIDVGGKFVTKHDHVVHFDDETKGQYTGKEGNFRTFKAGSEHIILGIDYIGKSVRNLEQKLNKLLVDLGGQFIEGMKKASS